MESVAGHSASVNSHGRPFHRFAWRRSSGPARLEMCGYETKAAGIVDGSRFLPDRDEAGTLIGLERPGMVPGAGADRQAAGLVAPGLAHEIGRASCRERVWPYG